jgi:glycosyltransferase involved in cell wall biosynthesis
MFLPLSSAERDIRRKQLGIDGSQVVFSFLGTLGQRKGIDTLVQAFQEVEEEHPGWMLWLIGPYTPAENQNLVKEQIQTAMGKITGDPKRIRLWGRIDDRKWSAMLLASSDVFVIPSRKEGMGLAPLEAMAAGVPVIVSKIPGVTDLANIDEETGLYITPGNVAQLKAAMVRLANHKELREEMGRKAHQRIVESFSWRKNIDQLEKLYNGAMQ